MRDSRKKAERGSLQDNEEIWDEESEKESNRKTMSSKKRHSKNKSNPSTISRNSLIVAMMLTISISVALAGIISYISRGKETTRNAPQNGIHFVFFLKN